AGGRTAQRAEVLWGAERARKIGLCCVAPLHRKIPGGIVPGAEPLTKVAELAGTLPNRGREQQERSGAGPAARPGCPFQLSSFAFFGRPALHLLASAHRFAVLGVPRKSVTA